jgi:hypothetical protein
MKETKMNKNKTEQPKRPTHVLYQVQGDDKARWTRIGAGWLNKDGKGINVVLDAVPLSGRIVLREVGEQDETQGDNGGQQ